MFTSSSLQRVPSRALRSPVARVTALLAAAACIGVTAAGPAAADAPAPAAPVAAPSTVTAPASSDTAPTTAEPVMQPAVEPALQQVLAEPVVEPATAEPAPSAPVAAAPATDTPVADTPVADTPLSDTPVAAAPVAAGDARTAPVTAAATAPSTPELAATPTLRTAAAAKATAPVVTTQPVETWVDLGTSATFTAHASGTPTPTVQWQYRRWTEDAWVDIPGATSDSYTTPPASLADPEPGYRAVFTNSAGSVATGSADLRLNQLPPDPGTPSAPRDVTAHQTAPGQITITWSAPADDGDSPITGYGAGYGTRRWGNGDDFSPSTFRAVFDGIADGDYTATVFAVNDAGMGWRVFVPVSVGAVPTAPRHLAATRSGSAVTLTWADPARAGYGPVEGYAVVLTSGSHRLTRTLPASATGTRFLGLPSGTWRVTVTAANIVGAGTSATLAIAVPATTPTAPSKPSARPPAAAIPAVAPAATPAVAPAATPAAAPAAAPSAGLARTGSESLAQTTLALVLLLLGLVTTTAARRLRTTPRT